MDITINKNNYVVEATESAVYELIGKIALAMAKDIPNVITVSTPLGDAEYKLNKRGTFVKDGEAHPSMFVVESFNNIEGLETSAYDKVN